MATKHGQGIRNGRTREYRAWLRMRDRCNNPNNNRFDCYGGRGITVCEEWNSFVNFFKDMGECTPGLSLERIKNDEGYSKDNCKWATRKEQGRNQRTNTHLTAYQRTQVLAAWAEELGCNSTAILYHLSNDKSMEWIVDHFQGPKRRKANSL